MLIPLTDVCLFVSLCWYIELLNTTNIGFPNRGDLVMWLRQTKKKSQVECLGTSSQRGRCGSDAKGCRSRQRWPLANGKRMPISWFVPDQWRCWSWQWCLGVLLRYVEGKFVACCDISICLLISMVHVFENLIMMLYAYQKKPDCIRLSQPVLERQN